ncbi:uncharacterized protein MELLADRAFT_79297 [Melampsora larici-populina 98AG31]|uniref:Uncharacterized protein n=1 Tax=Melampsora larici-populina (strain 98AG31 / pathotype 3-4-7) TaxID=747676 RepID=F4S571_MELLP|nr:uncharacterized protein MELLADRAFT_79297 [Melampsora larici-populina 98AG31]EGG00213.1 hypothetical protein MELLADRAFT_79297 [Melampsora larici-populina 98AG31]
MINITTHQFAPSLRSNVYDTSQFPFSEKFQIKDHREIDGDDEDDGLDSLDSLMISKKRSNVNEDINSSIPPSKFQPDVMKIDLDQFKSIPSFDLNSINSLSKLSQFQTNVINHFQKFPEDCSKSNQARKIIHDFRRKILQKNFKESDETQTPSKSNQDWSESETIDQESNNQPFDRLIYLLDRYTDYCHSIHLSPWPIHHLKVVIWIQGDVVSTKTRVVPLRKSVRCYVTSLETVRLKTYHLFDHDCEGDEKMLMNSEVLLEILEQLPITRSTINPFHSNLVQNSNSDHEAFDQFNHGSNKLGNFDRVSILRVLNDQSGDHKLEIALNSIREARRQSQVSQNGYKNSKKFSKPKPDPHLHTLNRYQTFCKSIGIPVFPIESVRVSIWLKESVLCLINEPNQEEEDERNSLRYKVSLRTVQVYLSRLEYARWEEESNSTRPSTRRSSSESNSLRTDREEIETIGSKRRWSSLEIDERSEKDLIMVHKGHISYILCDEDYYSIEEKKIKLESDWKVNPLSVPRSYYDYENPRKTFLPSFDRSLLSSV